MNSKQNIKAVIFDYDGTLADTESVSAKLYPIVFKELGCNLNKNQTLELRSSGYPHRSELLKKWYNCKNPDALTAKIRNKMHKAMDKYKKEHPIQLKPYVKEVLSELTKLNVKIVIASSTIKSRLETQLANFNIRQYFDEVYSVESVKYGKPYSDIYEYVCYKLNLEPSECIAVEDCPNGVISACSAGCNTIMVPDLTQPDKELKNKYKFKVCKNLKEIIKYIKTYESN